MSKPKEPDLIGDLFASPEPKSNQKSATSEPRTLAGTILIAVLAMVLVLLMLQRCDLPFGDRGDGGDRHEQKQDDHKRDQQKEDKQSIAVKPGTLLVLRERQFPSIAENEVVEMIAAFCGKHQGLQYRDLDKDAPDEATKKFVAHAAGKSVVPPCVVFRGEDGTLAGAIKLPTNEAELMEAFR